MIVKNAPRYVPSSRPSIFDLDYGGNQPRSELTAIMGEENRGVLRAKEFLYQAKDAQREVDNIKQRISVIQKDVAGYEDDMDEGILDAVQAQHLIDADCKELDGLKAEMREKERELRKALRRVSDKAAELSDGLQQSIVLKRYVDMMSWDDIAKDLDMNVRTIQMEHGRALIELEDGIVNK